MKKNLKSVMTVLLCLVLAVALIGCAAAPPAASESAAPAGEASASNSAESSADGAKAVLTPQDAGYWDGLPYKDVLPLDAGAAGDKEIVIGFSQTAFNHPWRVEMINSAEAEVARHPNVKMVTTDGNADVVKQSSDIRDLISQGVDAIVMSPVESGGLVGAVEEATAAGIPVIVLDRDVFTDKRTVFIGQSNYTMGAAVAQKMADDLGGKGKILEITGLMGSSPAIGRQEGMMSVLEKYPEIEILATGDGEWIREPAVKLMEDWLTAYPQIDAVFSHAEESSWGAQLAIERAARQGEGIKHYTMDGSNQGFVSVKDGEFQADGNYTPFIGQLGIRAALYTIMGKEIPDTQDYEYGKQIVLPDLPVVVAENAGEWVGKGWGEYEE